jgi:hypothetical protein
MCQAYTQAEELSVKHEHLIIKLEFLHSYAEITE